MSSSVYHFPLPFGRLPCRASGFAEGVAGLSEHRQEHLFTYLSFFFPMKTLISFDDLQTKLKTLKNSSDVESLLRETVQTMLASERQQKSEDAPRTGRGGWRRKKFTEAADAEEMPASESKPSVYGRHPKLGPTRKYETVDDPMEEKIVAMYAKGLTTRDIHGYLRDVYHVEISQEKVSSNTDKVLPLVKEWQVRPLSRLYPILYLDGVHFKVREAGKIVNKCAYIILGINEDGMKEILTTKNALRAVRIFSRSFIPS